MALNKTQKQEIVKQLTEDVKNQKSLVFVSVDGLKVKDLSALRKKVREVGGKIQVIKKTLMKLVFEKAGLKFPEGLVGEIALIFGIQDETAPIKSAYEFSKKNENLKLLDGILENNLIGKENIIAIAQLPSKKELLGKLVGTVAAPMSGILNVLQGNMRGLVVVLNAIGTKK